MQQKYKQQIKLYKTFVDNLKREPIKLLKIIKEYSLNYLANKYDIMIILDALQNFVILKQKKMKPAQLQDQVYHCTRNP